MAVRIMYSTNGFIHRINAKCIDINYCPEKGVFSFVFKAEDFDHVHTFEINSALKGINVEQTLALMLECAWDKVNNNYYRVSNTMTISTFEKIVSLIEERYNEGKFE